MKQTIKEALDDIKKEKFYNHIFQLLDKNLTIRKDKKHPNNAFFGWEGKEDRDVLRYGGIEKFLYWDYNIWPSFFENFSMERDDFVPILKAWVEKTLNCEVVTTISVTFPLN